MDLDATQQYGSASGESMTESELREIRLILESSDTDPNFQHPDLISQNIQSMVTQTSHLPPMQQGQELSGNPASRDYINDVNVRRDYLDSDQGNSLTGDGAFLSHIQGEAQRQFEGQVSLNMSEHGNPALGSYDTSPARLSSSLQIPTAPHGYISPQYTGSRRDSFCSDVESFTGTGNETVNSHLSPLAFPPRSGSSLSQHSDVSGISSPLYPDFQPGVHFETSPSNLSASSFDYSNSNSAYLDVSDNSNNGRPSNTENTSRASAPTAVSGDDFLKFLLPEETVSEQHSVGYTNESDVPQVTISPAIDDSREKPFSENDISAPSHSPASPSYCQPSFGQNLNISLQVPNAQGFNYVSSPQYTSSGLSDTEGSSPYSPGAKSDDSVGQYQMDNCQILNFFPTSEQPFLETKRKRGRPAKRSSSTPRNFNRHGYNESPQAEPCKKEENNELQSSKARRHSTFLSVDETSARGRSPKGRARSGSGSANSGKTRSRSRSQSSREYFLELATGNKHSRPVRTHPANYECPLCESRFTRAYNLQSHLRTHANERPFSCRNCGKSFSRAHDRKRHENLHTGERKYRCFGYLADNVSQWGCGRSFARADALSRHFRSEQGKLCIKALFDEERRERLEKERRDIGDTPEIQVSDMSQDDLNASVNEEIYRHLMESIAPFSGSDAEGGSLSASGQDEPSPSIRSENSWT